MHEGWHIFRACIKERFQIKQKWVLATGNQVLIGNVGGPKCIEQSEIASLPLIKAFYLSLCCTLDASTNSDQP